MTGVQTCALPILQDNLRKWKTGGLRRISATTPFRDVIYSSPTRRAEHRLAPHPSLKPQQFVRQLVLAALPFGAGVILDPFMGSGSTMAASAAQGLKSIGLEIDPEFFAMARTAIPKLAAAVTEDGLGIKRRQAPMGIAVAL